MAACSSVRVAKQGMRMTLKEALKAMTPEQKKDESIILTQKLLQCQYYLSASRVSVYLHMPAEEVDTSHIVKNIFDSGKLCFVPRFIGNNMDMLRVHSVDDMTSLPTHKWGIKQPRADDNERENALDTGGLDLIIVPGLGFTKDGKRLGRGKGFYDGFIRKCQELNSSTKTIALGYSVQLCDDIPTDSHDRTIDLVIFP